MKASKWMKRLVTGLLSSALILAGGMILPSTVRAADATVHYTVQSKEQFEAWKSDNTKIPTEDGFLFGGWYKSNRDTDALLESEVATYEGDIYAKFVPSYVLSVKTQLDSNTATKGQERVETEYAEMRILTGVDNLQYKEIGVQILLANKNDMNAPAQSKVYQNLLIGDQKLSANEMFGAAANYFGVWTLTDIEKVNDAKIIYVRPYWVTKDGTTVYGLAKYVHVEDSYESNRYISVPINMMSEKDAAAGAVTLTYNTDMFELATTAVENGRVYGEGMSSDVNTSGTVKIIGNDSEVKPSKADETLFANVRLKRKDNVALYKGDGNGKLVRNEGFFNFTVESQFCNWDEEVVEKGWNIQY